MNKTILFVTGTRADFGKLEPLAEIAAENNFNVQFFVTGMHMLKEYGLTKLEIRNKKKFGITEFINHRTGDPQDLILTKSINGLSDYLNENAPDLVIVHGDRVEALAACLVCAFNYIPCAHIEGGEVSGTIDESLRHCNSKLANYHFTSSEDASNRVIRLGENPKAIYCIGSPELDIHRSELPISINDVKRRYDINFSEYGIMIFHPVTSEQNTIEKQFIALAKGMIESDKNFVVILPNNDPGCDQILKNMDLLASQCFKIIPSMRFNYFSILLRNSSIVIGNSSLGVREAPFLGIPSLNIGSRQTNRSSSESIFNIDALSPNSIPILSNLIKENWGAYHNSDSSFGRGTAADSFLKIIQSDEFWNLNFQKYFVD